jgi:hypothetical protein
LRREKLKRDRSRLSNRQESKKNKKMNSRICFMSKTGQRLKKMIENVSNWKKLDWSKKRSANNRIENANKRIENANKRIENVNKRIENVNKRIKNANKRIKNVSKRNSKDFSKRNSKDFSKRNSKDFSNNKDCWKKEKTKSGSKMKMRPGWDWNRRISKDKWQNRENLKNKYKNKKYNKIESDFSNRKREDC